MKRIYLGVGSTLRCYEDPGTSAPTDHEWSFDHGATAYAVAVDSVGNSYVGGIRTSNITHRKINAAGTEIWSADHGANVRCIAVDADFNVYVVGDNVSGISFRKYNSSGTEVWSKNLTVNFRRVRIADDGYIYVAGATTGSVNVRRYSADGTPISAWGMPGTSTIIQEGLAVCDGFIYTGHNRVSSITNRKYNTSGISQWAKDHGATVRGVAVDADGNVWAGGNASSSISLRKYNSAGTELWTYNTSAINDLALDSDQNAFVATQFGNLEKIDSGGSRVWEYSIAGIHYAIALSEDIELFTNAPSLSLPIRLAIPLVTPTASNTSQPPGLALPFALRVPLLITDREDIAPGLALNLALRMPTLRLEHPQADQFAEVYALYLGGALLPFSSITARRDIGGLNLTVTIPSASAELLNAVAANEGEMLRVLRGPRLPDGSVQLDGMWSAVLDSWSYRAGAESGSITLQASTATAIQTARPRPLRGVSYVGNDRGARQVRCRIDTYLQPGDVALLGGGQSIVVTDLTYSIQSGQAAMDVRGF